MQFKMKDERGKMKDERGKLKVESWEMREKREKLREYEKARHSTEPDKARNGISNGIFWE